MVLFTCVSMGILLKFSRFSVALSPPTSAPTVHHRKPRDPVPDQRTQLAQQVQALREFHRLM